MTFCPNCGSKVESNLKFCSQCGTKLEEESPQQQSIYVQPQPQPMPTPTPTPVQSQPPDVQNILKTVIVQLEAGDINQAIASFDQATQLDPKNSQAKEYLRQARWFQSA